MAVLLAVWAAVGLGGGVLLADVLNQFRLGGFPLGFWLAQQGSILTFVALILVYALALNRLDDRHRRELEGLRRAGSARAPGTETPGTKTPATGGRALRKSGDTTSDASESA